MFNALVSGVTSAINSAQASLDSRSPLEKMLGEALEDSKDGSPTALYSKIADATRNRGDFAVITREIWLVLGSGGPGGPRPWRCVFKGLVLLEYLIKHGVSVGLKGF